MFCETLTLITELEKQNPPWQYVTSNESGIAGTSSGVIIDILDEISKKLNFTYVLHLAQVSTNLNMTDDLNATVSRESLQQFELLKTKLAFADDKRNPSFNH